MLFGHREMQEVLMNMDNQRLKEIQLFKNAYGNELVKAESIEDCLIIQSKIDELEKEEIEILGRCSVEV